MMNDNTITLLKQPPNNGLDPQRTPLLNATWIASLLAAGMACGTYVLGWYLLALQR